MKTSTARCMAAMILGALGMAAAAEEPADVADRWTSERGKYVVSFSSSIDPMPINKMFEWTLHVEDADGEPVDGARFAIAGGMPEHNHGLPTSPRVTEDLGNGDYRLQGIRFHMKGNWQFIISIFEGAQADRVVIDLQL